MIRRYLRSSSSIRLNSRWMTEGKKKGNSMREMCYKFFVINISNNDHPRQLMSKVHCVPGMVRRALDGLFSSLQFNSVTQLCPTLFNLMDHSMPGFPVNHQLPEFTQTHVHWVGDAIQLSHPLLSPSPPALNLSQHQGLFKWVSSLHQVAKVFEFQLQHQSFRWTLISV